LNDPQTHTHRYIHRQIINTHGEKKGGVITAYTHKIIQLLQVIITKRMQISRNIFILSMQAANQTYIKYI